RKIYKFNWDIVCISKNLGSLGLQSAREVNKTFLMKMIWGLLSRSDELWALIFKYLTTYN
ncbi:hypothetical protein LINPERPRIM_LOCUS17539, partial [Linum perenne]